MVPDTQADFKGPGAHVDMVWAKKWHKEMNFYQQVAVIICAIVRKA